MLAGFDLKDRRAVSLMAITVDWGGNGPGTEPKSNRDGFAY